ncbi:tetratricopeptide repeat protein [Xylanimonas sp. McL0601]|uniref:tetratricopeptide repeat protein n=1 Tax=Xylanimonas sp. McL0601 TaxID=3414739 RepID=UPI003CF03DBE
MAAPRPEPSPGNYHRAHDAHGDSRARGCDRSGLRAPGSQRHGADDRLLRGAPSPESGPSGPHVRGRRRLRHGGSGSRGASSLRGGAPPRLTGESLRRCLCQYGSTLRWLGEDDASLEVLDRAAREFPDSDSVRIFRALTLNEVERHDEAVAELLTIVTNHPEVTDLGRYATGLAGLAAWYGQGRPTVEQERSTDV